ncbi:hypothetical protein ACI3LZ_003112 [Candidozyma auris]
MKFSTAVVSGLMARRDNTVVVLQDIENLLGHVVNDVSKVLADAGVNKKEFFGPILAPLDLDKRDDSVSKRDEATSEANVPAVVIDVGKLVSDILADVAKIVADNLIPF